LEVLVMVLVSQVMSGGDLMVVLLGLGGMLVGLAVIVTAIVSKSLVAATRVREEAALKARMVERGASVEEIERVLRASGPGSKEV
jgi:hypothetical protein